jgi:hypothetical protein
LAQLGNGPTNSSPATGIEDVFDVCGKTLAGVMIVATNSSQESPASEALHHD